MPEHHREWVAQQFAAVPRAWGRQIEKIRLAIHREKGEFEGNSWLRELAERCRKWSLPLSADDADIIAEAGKAATLMASMKDQLGLDPATAAGSMQRMCERYGIEEPTSAFIGTEAIISKYRKMCSPRWWRKKLRAAHGRRVEAEAQRLALVSKRRSKYITNEGLDRAMGAIRRNAAIMEAKKLANQGGQAMTLAELAAKTVANPAIRRGELMARCRGFEEWAKEQSDKAIFVTVTCPSRMHAVLSLSGQRNPNWAGQNPREAQKHLRDAWGRCRAALNRKKCMPYGFRVAEPHHDGTPHWHLLLFVKAEQVQIVKEAIVREFLKKAWPEEPGAEENRIKFEEIEASKGSATGYIAKYISKNIDAYAVQRDLYGDDAIEGAARVRAWASTWGIRQFQQIGGPPVSCWREMRRMPLEVQPTEDVRKAAEAAREGCWREFCRWMGGAACRRAERPIQPAYEREGCRWSPADGLHHPYPRDDERSRLRGRIVGVLSVAWGLVFKTRRWEWRPTHWMWKVGRWGLGLGLPWTRINNCTPPAPADLGISEGSYENGIVDKGKRLPSCLAALDRRRQGADSLSDVPPRAAGAHVAFGPERSLAFAIGSSPALRGLQDRARHLSMAA